jgi:Pvc16 N-terminal domain
MSHLIIGEVSEFLRKTLWLGIKEDPVTSQLVASEDEISLTNPGSAVQGVRKLSLWLYQVLPNEHLRNPSYVRRKNPKDANDDDAPFYPPLYLNLLYLLTPSIRIDDDAKTAIADQSLLGRAMQIFYDQSILRMDSKQAAGEADELHLSLAPRTIEELAEVWEAMQQPYRLSVCYEVRAIKIDSARRVQAGRLSERQSEFGPLVTA